jgi:oligopeptide transport system permease protein
MGSFIVKRVGLSLLTAWIALTFMFILLAVMPGDAIDARQGEKATGAVTQANQRAKYGLDKPAIVQYGKFWLNLGKGDLGYSFKNDRSVNTDLKETMKTSLRLLLFGGIVQIGGSLFLGFLSAAKKGSILDKTTTVFSILSQAIPVFVTGLLSTVLFGVIPFENDWGWANLNFSWPTEWHFGVIPAGNWKGIILPAIVVGIVQMAFLARLLRSSMLEVLRADYLRTAVAKGLSRRRVLFKHALRNALIPYVTAAGITLVEIFGIAVQTETVFSLYGVGSKVAEASLIQDTPVILGLSSVVILAATLMSLLVDLSYGLLDPRIRVGAKSA